MEYLNNMVIAQMSRDKDFIFNTANQLAVVAEDSKALGCAILEAIECFSSLSNRSNNEDSGKHAYQLTERLIKHKKQAATLKVLNALDLDVFYPYADTTYNKQGVTLLGLLLQHGARDVLKHLFMAGKLDLDVVGQAFRKGILDMHRTIGNRNMGSVTYYEKFKSEEINLAVNTAKYINEIAFSLLPNDTVDMLKAVDGLFSEGIEALVPVKRLGIDLHDVFDEGTLVSACEKTAKRIAHYHDELDSLRFDFMRRYDRSANPETEQDKARRLSRYRCIRRDIKDIRHMREDYDAVWGFIKEIGVDAQFHRYWQIALKRMVKARRSVNIKPIIAFFDEALGVTVVPGGKGSPAANLEWFCEEFGWKQPQDLFNVAGIVPFIRTKSQINQVLRCFDMSPSTLLMLHGNSMKPVAKKLCVQKLSESV